MQLAQDLLWGRQARSVRQPSRANRVLGGYFPKVRGAEECTGDSRWVGNYDDAKFLSPSFSALTRASWVRSVGSETRPETRRIAATVEPCLMDAPVGD